MYGIASELDRLEFISIKKRGVRGVKEMKLQLKWRRLTVNLTAGSR